MDPEVSAQYDHYFHLFRSKGWKQFVEDMEAVYDSYSIESIKDELDLARIHGERRILNNILNFETGIIQSYTSLVEGSDDSEI